MSQKETQDLLNPNLYQVFILRSSAALPFITFHHPWFVINEKGKVSRYEIRHTKNKETGHLYINAQEPFQGLPLIYGFNHIFQHTHVLKVIEGDEQSLAKRMLDFIKESPRTYPLVNRYSFVGPNCGTYVEWVLEHFSEIDLKLP